jgi:glycosyltransferase involved in cell wall biosynthesis
MRVVILAESFARNTSYIGVMLPRYLARMGVDVHLLSLDLAPYWMIPEMKTHYESLVGKEWLAAGAIHDYDGFKVHILQHDRCMGYVRALGLGAKLRGLRPDIVLSAGAIGWLPLEAAFWKLILGYKLFTGSHTGGSTFPLYHARGERVVERLLNFVTRWIPGRLVSLVTERCHAPTADCAVIAYKFFGVQKKKVEVLHLGVDTEVFHPIDGSNLEAERVVTRKILGFDDDELVLIYTGKITVDKRVDLIPEAVSRLRERGISARALIIGEGPAKDSISSDSNVTMLPFMSYQELARYYRASDIAVWPTTESTSMLDSAACGLPIIVSSLMVYREHVDGNGLVYDLGDVDSLVSCLQDLVSLSRRKVLGEVGAMKMANRFSWEAHARKRLEQYRRCLDRGA